MGKVHANAAGAILRVLGTEEQERQYPDPPPNATQTVDFDHDANSALLRDLYMFREEHTVVGGVLRRNGQPVTIAPPSPEYQDRAQLQQYWQGLEQYLGLSTPTGAQTAAAVKTIIRVLRLIYRLLRRGGQIDTPKGRDGA